MISFSREKKRIRDEQKRKRRESDKLQRAQKASSPAAQNGMIRPPVIQPPLNLSKVKLI